MQRSALFCLPLPSQQARTDLVNLQLGEGGRFRFFFLFFLIIILEATIRNPREPPKPPRVCLFFGEPNLSGLKENQQKPRPFWGAPKKRHNHSCKMAFASGREGHPLRSKPLMALDFVLQGVPAGHPDQARNQEGSFGEMCQSCGEFTRFQRCVSAVGFKGNLSLLEIFFQET